MLRSSQEEGRTEEGEGPAGTGGGRGDSCGSRQLARAMTEGRIAGDGGMAHAACLRCVSLAGFLTFSVPHVQALVFRL